MANKTFNASEYHDACDQKIREFTSEQLCAYKKLLRRVFAGFRANWNAARALDDRITDYLVDIFVTDLNSNEFGRMSMRYFTKKITGTTSSGILKETVSILSHSDVLKMVTICIQLAIGGNPETPLY